MALQPHSERAADGDAAGALTDRLAAGGKGTSIAIYTLSSDDVGCSITERMRVHPAHAHDGRDDAGLVQSMALDGSGSMLVLGGESKVVQLWCLPLDLEIAAQGEQPVSQYSRDNSIHSIHSISEADLEDAHCWPAARGLGTFGSSKIASSREKVEALKRSGKFRSDLSVATLSSQPSQPGGATASSLSSSVGPE
eukprot:3665439-Prymnesium_polylepis.1